MANIVEIIINAVDKTSGPIDGVNSKLKNLGTTLTKTGAAMTAGVTLPLALLGRSAINAASDLEESQNAVNQIFGESAEVIHQFGATSAETIGLATSEFNALSIVTASLLRNVGLSEDEVAGQTINLAQRAADMASVFNTDVDQAMQAIEAGLRGQTEPLTQYGVKLMQADINAKALAMGLAETTGELTQQDKAMAALELIFEQTAATAGDFINTSDQFANSQRILAAQVKDVSAEFGQALMPLLVELLPMITDAVKWFSDLSPEVKKVIVVVAGLVAGIGPLLAIIGTTITIVTTLAATLGLPVIAVVAIIAAVAALVAALIAFWPQIQAWGKNVIAEFIRIKDEVVKAVTGAWQSIKDMVTKWYQAGKDLIMGLVNGVKAAAQNLISAVTGAVGSAIDGAKRLLGISSPSKVFQDIGANMMEGWAKGIKMNASPQIAIQGATAGMVTAAAPPSRGGGGATVILQYSPVVSMADRYEAETKLVPYIESALRKLR